MTRPPSLSLFAVSLAALLSWGCGEAPSSEMPPPSVVLGLSADAPLAGELHHIDVTVTVGPTTVLEQTIAFDGSGAAEINIPRQDDGAHIIARLQAFGPDSGEPLIERTVSTKARDSRTMLIRVRLNDECIPQPGERDVSCPGTTCSAGVCVLPFISPHLLPDYTPSWAEPPQGQCGPVDAGEPGVTIGWPEPPFAQLSEGDLVTPQMGLQGGSHFFFSVRMQGADDASALTHFYGTVLSTGRETSVVSVADPYEITPEGCELYLVPLILPPVDTTGETMRLGVTVSDGTGNAGHGHVDIELAEPLPP